MTTTTNEMPIPSWVEDGKKKMFEAHSGMGGGKVEPRKLPVIDSFSTHFSEFEIRDKDLIVHLFPRGGESDRYWPAEYRDDGTIIPGRLEEKFDNIDFPPGVEKLIKAAVDAIWQGDVAILRSSVYHYGKDADVAKEQPVEKDLGSYVVQFQGGGTTATLRGVEEFVDNFCEMLDRHLEG
jgi:hypothetical protein